MIERCTRLDVGHAGLFLTPDAKSAETAVVAKHWIDATLYNDPVAKAQFVDAGCGAVQRRLDDPDEELVTPSRSCPGRDAPPTGARVVLGHSHDLWIAPAVVALPSRAEVPVPIIEGWS
jgi:hypothetical protein